MSGSPRVGVVVEGHGEVQAVPILVRRIALEIFGIHVDVQPPHRLARSKMCQPSELLRALSLQTARAGRDGGVLVVFDADDDEPAAVAQEVRDIAAQRDGRIGVAVAVKEFEAWFLAGLPSLTSHRDVRDDAAYAGDPQGRRNCKKQLELMMTSSYSETRHQPAFSSILNLELAQANAPSFRHLITAVGIVLGERSN